MKEILDLLRITARGIWRYRWPAMLGTWAICLVGWLVVYSMPNIYEARAVVFVDAQSRLANVIGQVGAAPGVGSQVFVVRQAMLSRPLLESVAEKTGLSQRAKTTDEKEALLTDMLASTMVETGRNREARDLYTISFQDSNRDMAVSVVSTLLDTFVNDVLDLKDQGSDAVSGYLDDQLDYYGQLLSTAEQDLADFKKKYVGLLPGESGGIFERLQGEMAALDLLRQNLRTEEGRRDELQRQLSAGSVVPSSPATPVGVATLGDPVESAIADLEGRRSDLLLTYTERHPDVVAISEQLDQLYAKRAARASNMQGDGSSESMYGSSDPVYQSVQIAMNDANVVIAGIRSEIEQREYTVGQLRRQADTIPEVEAQFTELTRNYAQYRELYSEIMVRRERERMGQVGQEREIVTFNIIDPPSATVDPVAPKRTLLLVGIMILGIGGGISLAFMFHLTNPVFHDPESLRKLTGRPVLGTVSMTWMERYKTKQRIGQIGYSTAGLALVAMFVSVVIFQEVGIQFVQGIASN